MNNGKVKKYVQVGEMVRMIATYSGVNMHMNLAGRPITASVKEYKCNDRSYYSTQYYYESGNPWTTVTLGEGGFFREETENGPAFYCYPDDGPGDDNPVAVQERLIAQIESALGDNVVTITNLGL